VEAIRLLLDERKLGIPGELDAIMCASDRIAMGCIAELKKRGIRVPEDVAVTGFNFLLEARSSRPSLSTVATPFEQKSRLAVQWLLSSLRHSPAQPKALEPIVMLGESCGCLNPHAGAPVRLCIGTLADEADWASCRTALDSIFPLFRHASAQSPERIDTVVTALRTALARDNPPYFSEQILAQLDTGQYEFMDVQIWSDVLLTLRHHLRRYCTSTELLACAELALHQARLLMSDYFSRQEMQQRQQEHQRAGELRQLSAELVYCSDMAGIARVLAQQLPAIGVASAWVALFETAQAQAADQARLLIALERGELYPLPAAGFFYPAAQLLPEGYCQPAGRRNLLLHPLSDGENEFGFTIFEVGPTDGAVYESLAYGIGTAVKSVMLRENLRRRSEDLELSLENLTRAQNQLVEAEKMVALGELVAGIAHEINTPIGIGVTAISSIADASRSVQNALVARDAQAVRRGIATIAEGTELASRNLHRAADLIASFKQISVDQSSLQIRRFRLSAYIDDIIKSLGSWLKRGQHQVELDCQPDLEITCDPGAIAQIFTNLIQNSISYGFDTRQNGLIRIACRRSSAGVIIDYSDNGVGMSTETVEKIFLPFFTTRRGKGGSGLGMHIVYNLVTQNLAGTIRCESQPGQGVRFHMVWTNC
jgi:signal transduction histidine kinase